jgi:sugar phosphate isomerase/epimerase
MPDLGSIAAWAAENGFSFLEIGPTIPLDEKLFEEVREKTGIRYEGFIFCRNLLSENPADAAKFSDGLLERARFAAKIGAKKLICASGVAAKSFSGNSPAFYLPEKSFPDIKEVLTPIIEECEKNGVKLCFEICPMMGTVVHTPYLWNQFFDYIGSDVLGLCFDPSHLVWQMIDIYAAVKASKGRIYHAHGKDCLIDRDALKHTGILQSYSMTAAGPDTPHGNRKNLWWEYKLPGTGEIDWRHFVDALLETGYDGGISVELEDPVYMGAEEMVKAGLIKARNHLQNAIEA